MSVELQDFRPQYLQYGEPEISSVSEFSIKREPLDKKIARFALCVLLGAAAGFLAGGALGACIGAILSGVVDLTYEATKEAHVRRVHKHFLQRIVVSDGDAQHLAEPKLGQMCPADVLLCDTPEKAWHWKKQLVAAAEQSIELSPNFAGGALFDEMLQLMQERMDAKPGLKVHILLSRDMLERSNIEMLTALKEKYPDRFHYLISDRFVRMLKKSMGTEENHVKLLVVDGKYAMTGGTGVSNQSCRSVASDQQMEKEKWDFKEPIGSKLFLDRSFCDTDIVVRGPSVAVARKQFFRLYQQWEQRCKDRIDEKSRFFSVNAEEAASCPSFENDPDVFCGVQLKWVVGSPEHGKANSITAELQKCIREAQSTIRFANLSFNPVKRLRQSLQAAKNRGVHIKAHLNGEDKAKRHNLFVLPNRANYPVVTKVYEHQVENQLYHKKVAVFDKKITYIGSYNFGKKSAKTDNEIACFIDSAPFALHVNASIKRDKAASIKVEGENLMQKPSWEGRLIAKYVAPLFL